MASISSSRSEAPRTEACRGRRTRGRPALARLLELLEQPQIDVAFARFFRYQVPEVAHLGLADAMDPAEPLLNPVRVPRQIVIHHQVGTLKVDALARGIGRQQNLDLGVVPERLLRCSCGLRGPCRRGSGPRPPCLDSHGGKPTNETTTFHRLSLAAEPASAVLINWRQRDLCFLFKSDRSDGRSRSTRLSRGDVCPGPAMVVQARMPLMRRPARQFRTQLSESEGALVTVDGAVTHGATGLVDTTIEFVNSNGVVRKQAAHPGSHAAGRRSHREPAPGSGNI